MDDLDSSCAGTVHCFRRHMQFNGMRGAWERTKARLHGAVMQDSTTGDMIFSVATLISELSKGITLMPGTVILTGTPPGVGMARTPQVFLNPGDTVEIEIEKIGVLKNRVVFE